MPLRIGLAAVLALTVAVPAHAARDVLFRDSPRSAVATCLRPAGAPGLVGLIGPVERRVSPYALLRLSRGGAELAGTARLGVLDECPAVAAAPNGRAIVAGAVRKGRSGGAVRAALAEPGGGFGAPLEVAPVRSSFRDVAVAVSPAGDAVVAWTVTRGTFRRNGRAARTRVFAALRPAGGRLTGPQALTPWRRGGYFAATTVRAGMDSSGTATAAWAQSIPDRGDIPSLSTIEAATAPPGGPFGPRQVVARPVQDTTSVELAVAADGRALLAHDGQEAVQVYERAPGGSAFARIRRLRARGGSAAWGDPAVAVAPGGSAVVAWRGGDGDAPADVLLTSRAGDGAWTAPAKVHDVSERALEDSVSFLAYGGSHPAAPVDLDNTGLRWR